MQYPNCIICLVNFFVQFLNPIFPLFLRDTISVLCNPPYSIGNPNKNESPDAKADKDNDDCNTDAVTLSILIWNIDICGE